MSEQDVLTVQADSADTSLGWATLGDRRWRCTVGAGGVREDKVEGDAATPAGTFPLRRFVRLRVSVTNVFDANVHPTFFALNQLPYLSDPRFSNGGRGNSLPGRGLQVGFEVRR